MADIFIVDLQLSFIVNFQVGVAKCQCVLSVIVEICESSAYTHITDRPDKNGCAKIVGVQRLSPYIANL